MADKYECFAALRLAEPEWAFRIHAHDATSATAIIAPHGGKIEPGTSAIARAIAADTFRLYLFEGRKDASNGDLHIKSTKFDEPMALEIVARSDYVVAIHGCAGRDGKVYLGGLDVELRDAIDGSLLRAGFRTGTHHDAGLQGTSPWNICNRSRRQCGVQLEVSRSLRDQLCVAEGAVRLQQFAAAIRGGISQVVNAAKKPNRRRSVRERKSLQS